MSLPETYPDPVFHGAEGERSAFLRAYDDAPDLGAAPGNTVHYLATGKETDGAFGLYRWTFGPHVSGPDPHFHRTIGESFYVLSGEILIHDGEDWKPRTAGDFVHVPPGGIHGFRNSSGEPASMLLMFTPGAPREEYFETLFAQGTATMTDEEKAAFYLRHDNYWL
ncbi:MAG: cupin domain-containing protein [Nocardioidaceae bacterium]|nr:cupin domain-containing protein [Nocardioidaceae bacterium]